MKVNSIGYILLEENCHLGLEFCQKGQNTSKI